MPVNLTPNEKLELEYSRFSLLLLRWVQVERRVVRLDRQRNEIAARLGHAQFSACASEASTRKEAEEVRFINAESRKAVAESVRLFAELEKMQRTFEREDAR